MKKFLTDMLHREIGEIISGLEINGKKTPYGVLNERAIRSTAGIMFLIGIITFFVVFFTKNFNYLYPVVILFWIQFFITVFFEPKYAPFSIIGRFFVLKQKLEYVGAIQKRFAWLIGLIMASMMIIFTMGFGIRGIVPIAICIICLAFMWFESAIGICVGCKIYNFLIKKKIIPQPEYKPACPGGSCSIDIPFK